MKTGARAHDGAPAGDARGRPVALFVTCLTETFAPRGAIAAVRVLEHLGCEVAFPQGQTCCGQPLYNNGFHGEAAGVAKRMIGVFEGHREVVTVSGSCAAMVRGHFPALLSKDAAWAKRARSLAARTYEFVEYLEVVLGVDAAALAKMGARWEGSAAVHEACHLRTIGRHGKSAGVLGGVAGLTTTPLEGGEQCCGFGGTFALKFAPTSGAMAADKAGAVRASGAGHLVCGDAGCAMNIEGACRRAGVGVRVTSAAEIIAESLGLMAPRGGA